MVAAAAAADQAGLVVALHPSLVVGGGEVPGASDCLVALVKDRPFPGLTDGAGGGGKGDRPSLMNTLFVQIKWHHFLFYFFLSFFF